MLKYLKVQPRWLLRDPECASCCLVLVILSESPQMIKEKKKNKVSRKSDEVKVMFGS